MADQTYKNHAQFVPLYHYVLTPIIALTIGGGIVNFSRSLGDHQRLYSASLILVLAAALLGTAIFARVFALKAQDRAIRAEENLRHFVLTGKLLDRRLTVPQIVGLRFASDEEFVALAERAATTGMSQKEIKEAIARWRPDYNRV